MLKFMRRHATGWMIKIMFSLIIVVFVFWGVGSFKEREKTVAEVGSLKVTMGEYSEAYKRLYNRYRTLYADRFDENVLNGLKLKEKAIDQIVDKYLFLLKAKELHIGVSDREYSEYVQSISAFRRNGRFDQKIYEDILKREGIDPKQFEKNERESMVVAKLMAVLQDNGFSPNDQEMEKSYMRERGLVKLGYLVFEPADFEKGVNVAEKEVSEIYEREKAIHKAENTYHLRYITIDDKSPVKDDKAYMELLKSPDIQAYGKAKGLDVVDLGIMKESEILKRLARFKPAEWLKGMKKGDISLPIRDDAKSCIFQVVSSEEGKALDRQEAYKSIRARIVSERAKMLARTKAESTLSDKSVNFSKNTGYLPRTSTAIPSIGTAPAEHSGVFALFAGKKIYDKPIEISGKYYIFGFEDEKTPDKSQYEREKQAYRQYYVAKAREGFLASLREELKKRTKVKVDYEAL
jgi:parvulin-like peptidyl-prolyl isomerase